MEKLPKDIVRTSDVIGKNVQSTDREDLGRVEEIVIDKVSGQVRYVVITLGGFLGFGEDYFAFPWKSISYDADEEGFILNVEKDKLKKEYGFSKENWPDMATWPSTVDRYYL
ncbi:MAG: PRC-barrel domain-containing protein [Tatlockia sp.]|nr:PRC-barrel domain-containing protein [Tatlockia sp.]